VVERQTIDIAAVRVSGSWTQKGSLSGQWIFGYHSYSLVGSYKAGEVKLKVGDVNILAIT
jgi:hypothetical protein